MKTILFALGFGLAAGGFVLSVANLAIDLVAWLRKRAEGKKKPPESE